MSKPIFIQGCEGEDDNIFSDFQLGLNRIWFMFLMLGFGGALAALMLCAERWMLPLGREDVFSEERRKAFR